MKRYFNFLFVTFIVAYLGTNVYGQNKAFSEITKYVKAEAKSGKKVTAKDVATLFKASSVQDTIVYGQESNANFTGLAELAVAALDSTHFVLAYRNTGDSDESATDCGVVKIGEIVNNSITYSPQYTFNAYPVASVAVAALSDTSFIVAFQDPNNFDYGTLVKGTIIDGDVQFGYNTVFNEGLTSNISIAGLTGDHFIVVYRDGGNLGYGTAREGDATYDYSITFSDPEVFNNGDSFDLSVKSPDGVTAIIAYRNKDNSDYGHVTIAHILGGVITLGQDIPFNATPTFDISLDTFNDTTFVIAYRGSSNQGMFTIGSMAYPQITLGQPMAFTTTPVSDISVSAVDDMSFMVAYTDSAAGNFGSVKLLDKNGVVLNVGNTDPFFTTRKAEKISVVSLNSEDFVIAYQDADAVVNGRAVSGKIGFNALLYGKDAPINLGIGNYNSISALDDTHFVLVYSDGSNSEYGTAVIGEVVEDTIKYGPEYVFYNKPTNETVVTALDETHFVVAFLDVNNGFSGVLKLGEVTGTAINFGADQPFSKFAKTLAMTTLNDTTFVLAYVSLENGVQAVASVEKVKNNVISGEMNYGFKNSEVENLSIEALDQFSFIITYRDIDNGYAGTSLIGHVAGTVINYGNEVVFNPNRSNWISLAALDPTQVVIAYSDFGNGDYGTVVTGSVVGDTIVYGPPLVFNSDVTRFISVLGLSNSEFMIVNASGDGYFIYNVPQTYLGDVVGGTITVESKPPFYERSLGYQTTFATKLFNEGEEAKVVIGYMDANNRTGSTKIGWINYSTVSVEKENVYISGYELFQNYPNPFNPTTTIKFNLPQAGMVSLKVYNVLGQEVATLLNKPLKAGVHQVSFNASNLSSGIYFYRLESKNYNAAKRMILLK